jgi:hypothetical protein
MDEGDEPNAVVDRLDAEDLACEHGGDVDLLALCRASHRRLRKNHGDLATVAACTDPEGFMPPRRTPSCVPVISANTNRSLPPATKQAFWPPSIAGLRWKGVLHGNCTEQSTLHPGGSVRRLAAAKEAASDKP